MTLEPFGILQFLQSLLPQTPKTDDEPPSQTEEPTSQKSEQSAKEQSPAVEENRATDAILQYMEEHDKRARKLKK